MLFLLNNEGVIITVEAPIVSHVICDEVEMNTISRSALQSEHDSGTQPSKFEVAINELCLALEDERQKSATQLVKLTEVAKGGIGERETEGKEDVEGEIPATTSA